MANNKTGFNYYSTDTDRYQDRKIKRLRKQFSCSGIAVYDYLLCEIYRVKGCYMDFGKDTIFDVSDYFGIDEEDVAGIVDYCCEVELFDKNMLVNKSILTSFSIQSRFLDWSKKAKRYNTFIPNDYLIIRENISKLLEESPIIQEESAKLQEESIQSKVKESKVKESKEKKSKEKKTFVFSPPSISDVSAYVIGLCDISDQGAQKFAEKFVKYYESVEWTIGKGSRKSKMKDWHRSVNGQWRDDVDEIATKYPKLDEKAVFDPNNPVETFAAYKKPQFVH